MLIQIICEMIEISYNVQIQMINTKGLLAISYHLEKVTRFNPSRIINALQNI